MTLAEDFAFNATLAPLHSGNGHSSHSGKGDNLDANNNSGHSSDDDDDDDDDGDSRDGGGSSSKNDGESNNGVSKS